MRTSSPASSSSALSNEVGYLRAPTASRSASDRLAGSTSTGSGGASPRSRPSSPDAIRPPSARYGLHEVSIGFSSRFVEAASRPQKVDGTRMDASRLSGPQHTYAEDQKCGWRRRYELNDGAVSPRSPGRWASTPAMKLSATPDRPNRPPGS